MCVARQIEADLKSLAPEIKLIASTTGSSNDAGFSALMNQSSNNIITMTVTFPERSQRQRTVFEIAEVFRQYLGNRADVVFSNVSTNMGFGGSGNNNVSVEIYGYDFEATNKVAEEIKNKMKDVKGARNITVSRDEDRAELQINSRAKRPTAIKWIFWNSCRLPVEKSSITAFIGAGSARRC